jgi:hypothetical protein
MYGVDPEDGGWVVLGSPDSIDPDSGTTPDEYLAAVREDVDGTTLRRMTDGMSGLTTRQLDDGSTVYGGSVAAGLIARETGSRRAGRSGCSRSATWPTTRRPIPGLRSRPR